MRIVCATNYSLAEARHLYDSERYPEQNLYGALALERAGHSVECLTFETDTFLHTLSSRLRGRVGDLGMQRSLLRSNAELAFVGVDRAATVLANLRGLRLLRRPIVAIYHNAPRADPLSRRAARGYDVVFALSRVAYDALRKLRRSGTHLLSWGPQMDFPSYAPTSAEYVVSAGKSGRDIDLLADAIEEIEVPAMIYCPSGWSASSPRIIRRPSDFVRDYAEVLADMAHASVVAIPLKTIDRMVGLTEVNDALALAKPIVVTRTPHIDVPIEQIGCGFTVELGDRKGWAKALRVLHDDPGLAREMGERGRCWAERNWNSEICGQQIVDAISELVRTMK